MSITIDTYRYEEIYPSFKAATDEKEKTARINAAFLNRLADANLVLSGGDPISVADIGSGPCDTLVKYLTGVKFAPGSPSFWRPISPLRTPRTAPCSSNNAAAAEKPAKTSTPSASARVASQAVSCPSETM